MSNGFVIKGNICQTKNPRELDLHESAFAVCVDGVSRGIFNTLPEEYASLPLYDYGDAMRFGTNTGAEDEKDLDKVHFDLELFRAFSKGFCGAVGKDMTEKEKELLPYSAYLMTMECGMRFLTDYLQGDTYFKIHHEGHNLERCHTQMKLVADMETKMDEMKRIVAEC